MKRILVKDLRQWIGKEVESDFLISRKIVKSTRDGSPFLDLTLTDISGSVKGVAFEGVQSLNNVMEEGRVMRLRGLVDTFNEMLQVKVQTRIGNLLDPMHMRGETGGDDPPGRGMNDPFDRLGQRPF